jgi:hypothetical protein
MKKRRYLAVAQPNGMFRVSEIYAGCGEIHGVSNCREFATFEEADNVARDLADGKYPEIRPAGQYICNR